MGALPELIKVGLYHSCAAIDMVLILLLFRIVGQWRRIGWIEIVNDKAKEIVDPLTAAIGRRWQALMGIRLSQRGVLAATTVTLCLAWLMLQALAGLLT